jgi:GT2 family glycosyltransferase
LQKSQSNKKSSVTIDLSIVIPSTSRPELLRKCLDTLAAHGPPGSEVIVIDDGSPGAVISQIAGRWRATVHRFNCRGGFARAANAGLRLARHEIVELLNDDTEVTAGWWKAACRHFADPTIAAVAPLVLQVSSGRPNTVRVDSAGDDYYLGGVARKRHHAEKLSKVENSSRDVFGVSACAAFYRRTAAMNVGGFPEPFGAYFEDVDLAFRLHRAGHRLIFEPSSRVWHHGGSSYGEPRGSLAVQMSRNEELVFWRNLPTADLYRALPNHLAVLGAKLLRRAGEGNLIPFLWGRLAALRLLPHIFRHRRMLAQAYPASDMAGWRVQEASPLEFAPISRFLREVEARAVRLVAPRPERFQGDWTRAST